MAMATKGTASSILVLKVERNVLSTCILLMRMWMCVSIYTLVSDRIIDRRCTCFHFTQFTIHIRNALYPIQQNNEISMVIFFQFFHEHEYVGTSISGALYKYNIHQTTIHSRHRRQWFIRKLIKYKFHFFFAILISKFSRANNCQSHFDIICCAMEEMREEAIK